MNLFSRSMRSFARLALGGLIAVALAGCGSPREGESDRGAANSSAAKGGTVKILFLHHSTGKVIWSAGVERCVQKRRTADGSKYRIEERAFPKESPYGWNNYPYDYWNIWVNHAGDEPYLGEPTLEILSKEYDMIVWKHCFPVSAVVPDAGTPDIASPEKRVENYRLQYLALREKMRSFPQVRFLVWTGAALVRGGTSPEAAERSRAFFEWVRKEWDEPGDNIFVWDFHGLETEGGLYLKDENAAGATNSHPNAAFARRAAPLLCNRIVAVLEGRGDGSSLTGAE